ncbi:MAG: HlyC/CorC family transporter [Lachnospiraceae bacterium]|nr:HlyC/CorC family transporter [Lachnospiraceae bacterium]
MTLTLIICGFALCIVFSAFFSASEMALSSANRIRMENEAEGGNRRASKALRLIDRFDDALSTILIGNNLVNTAASSLASVFVILIAGDDMTWIATIVTTVIVIIFGESIPKISAKKSANRFTLFCAPFIYILRIVFFPLVWIVVKLTDLITRSKSKSHAEEPDEDESVRELQSIIETAEDEGVLDEDRSELVQAAIEFNDTSASEVMTARVDVDAIDIDDPLSDILIQVQETTYSRLPVYEDSIDNIIGTLHLNRLFQALAESEEVDIRELLLPPVYVYKTMKLPSVLRELRAAKQHLAIVTDEYSGTLGVVSFEDVLEEIVGDIWDESDEIEKEVVQTGETSYDLDGDMTVYDFLELMEIPEDEFEFESETVGGWVIEMLDRFPAGGEEFDYRDLHITVLEAEDRRVEKVHVEKKPAEQEEE